MKVLICGGRNYENYSKLVSVIWELKNQGIDITTIIHGKARGADALAERYANEHNLNVIRFPADWKKHGKGAGPIRNKEMLVVGKPNFVIALPGGVGTNNMILQAKKAGIKVIEVSDGEI